MEETKKKTTRGRPKKEEVKHPETVPEPIEEIWQVVIVNKSQGVSVLRFKKEEWAIEAKKRYLTKGWSGTHIVSPRGDVE